MMIKVVFAFRKSLMRSKGTIFREDWTEADSELARIVLIIHLHCFKREIDNRIT